MMSHYEHTTRLPETASAFTTAAVAALMSDWRPLAGRWQVANLAAYMPSSDPSSHACADARSANFPRRGGIDRACVYLTVDISTALALRGGVVSHCPLLKLSDKTGGS